MVNNQSANNPLKVPTGNDADCKLGRRAIHVEIDFSLGTKYALDLSQIQSLGAMDCLQTMYVDNADNAAELTLTMGLTLQRIIIPANAQAYIPILQPNPPVLEMSTTGAPVVNVQLLNFFVPPIVFYPNGVTVVDSTLAAVISNGAVNVNTQARVVSNPTDGSGTITVGGTAQQIFAADAARKRFIISNPSTATEVLSFTYGASTHFIDLAPGQTWDEADNSISGDAISVVAATTGHAFTAFQW